MRFNQGGYTAAAAYDGLNKDSYTCTHLEEEDRTGGKCQSCSNRLSNLMSIADATYWNNMFQQTKEQILTVKFLPT